VIAALGEDAFFPTLKAALRSFEGAPVPSSGPMEE
jgi:hypothetical protein